MISKVVFLGDLYRGNQATNVNLLYNIISPVLNQLEVECKVFTSKVNHLVDPSLWREQWRLSLIDFNSKYWNEVGVKENTAVIGFELPENLKSVLNECNIKWINIEIHPIRFLKDICFNLEASFDFDNSSIQVSKSEIELCTNMMYMKYKDFQSKNNPNSLMIIGQEPFDRSIFYDGTFKSLKDYLPKLDELANKYDQILVKPNPFKSNTEIDKFLINRYSAKNVKEENIYRILVSGKVVELVAISSSVLFEAPYFGIKATPLEPRVKKNGMPISYQKLIDSREFWVGSFLKQPKTKKFLKLSNVIPEQFLRNTFSYWGYETKVNELSHRMISLESRLAGLSIGGSQNTFNFTKQEFFKNIEELANETKRQKEMVQQAETKTKEVEIKVIQVEADMHNILMQYQAVVNSRMWRMTFPFRWAIDGIKWFFRGCMSWVTFKPGSRPRRTAKLVLLFLRNWVLKHPAIKTKLLIILQPFPRFKVWLRCHLVQMPTLLECLTPRGREIYTDLKLAVVRHQQKND